MPKFVTYWLVVISLFSAAVKVFDVVLSALLVKGPALHQIAVLFAALALISMSWVIDSYAKKHKSNWI